MENLELIVHLALRSVGGKERSSIKAQIFQTHLICSQVMCIIRKKQHNLCCIFHTSLKSEKNGVIKRVIKTVLIKFRKVLLRKTSGQTFCCFRVSGYCKPEILLFLLNVSFILVEKLSIRPLRPIKQEDQHPLKEGPANGILDELCK